MSGQAIIEQVLEEEGWEVNVKIIQNIQMFKFKMYKSSICLNEHLHICMFVNSICFLLVPAICVAAPLGTHSVQTSDRIWDIFDRERTGYNRRKARSITFKEYNIIAIFRSIG